MARHTDYVILCEDERQYTFARRFLIGRGAHDRKFTARCSPPGRGSGQKWVLDHFADELQALRRYRAPGRALVVLLDADTRSVEERLQDLQTVLRESGVAPISPNERVGIFVAKRNIETWILHVTNPHAHGLDEQSDYSRQTLADRWQSIVQEYAHARKPKPNTAPRSWHAACRDWDRVAP